jgi:hypothetical protein
MIVIPSYYWRTPSIVQIPLIKLNSSYVDDGTDSPVNLLVISAEFVSCNEIPPQWRTTDVFMAALAGAGARREKRFIATTRHRAYTLASNYEIQEKNVSMCVNESK